MTTPSGPVTIASGPIEVDLLPDAGARIHRLRVFGQDLLRTPTDLRAHEREPVFWGSYVMAPWCNRVAADTPVTVGARVVRLPANFADGTAIHGQVFTRAWDVDGPASFVVRAGGDGWPWEYEVRQRVAIEGTTLRLHHALANLARDAMPAGLGIHPWFVRPLRIAIHARRVHRANTSMERAPVPVNADFDLRQIRDVPDDMDGCWADLDDPQVQLEWPHLGLRATLRAAVTTEPSGTVPVAEPSLFIVMASPRDVDAVGVEPQSNVPQGLARLLAGEPGALTLLESGQALRLAVELAFESLEGVGRVSPVTAAA